MIRLILRCALGFLFLSSFVFADVNIYDFKNKTDEARFKALITDLRCPKCQNQNIADSNAELAKDLKDYVYKMVKEGKSDQEVIQFMVDRYGDFVLYTPPVKPITWFLWFAPALFLILVLTWFLLSTRKQESSTKATPLTEDEKKILKTRLQSKGDL